MRAMVLKQKKGPLVLQNLPIPVPRENELLVQVSACGVCRTDLHIVAGELDPPHLPLILGHQIVGRVVEDRSGTYPKGTRVGIPWLGYTCGTCFYCQHQKENLCDNALFTGFSRPGGFAEYTVAHVQYVFPLPQSHSDTEMAPLLCPGFIGYRSLSLTEGAKKIGFYGFGVAAHILVQLVNFQGGSVYAFTREGDLKRQAWAKKQGAIWAGDLSQTPPEPLDAAIVFAPVGSLYPLALQHVRKGGIVVSAGIHMSDIPSFAYHLLWNERVMRSVANLTRQDGEEFLKLAEQIPVKTEVTTFPLEKVNEAIAAQKEGKIQGAAVIVC